MIIPVRCFTCGKVLADKWAEYERRISQHNDAKGVAPKNTTAPSGATVVLDSFRGDILNDLGITRMCCRRHMLTHVDLIDVI